MATFDPSYGDVERMMRRVYDNLAARNAAPTARRVLAELDAREAIHARHWDELYAAAKARGLAHREAADEATRIQDDDDAA